MSHLSDSEKFEQIVQGAIEETNPIPPDTVWNTLQTRLDAYPWGSNNGIGDPSKAPPVAVKPLWIASAKLAIGIAATLTLLILLVVSKDVAEQTVAAIPAEQTKKSQVVSPPNKSTQTNTISTPSITDVIDNTATAPMNASAVSGRIDSNKTKSIVLISQNSPKEFQETGAKVRSLTRVDAFLFSHELLAPSISNIEYKSIALFQKKNKKKLSLKFNFKNLRKKLKRRARGNNWDYQVGAIGEIAQFTRVNPSNIIPFAQFGLIGEIAISERIRFGAGAKVAKINTHYEVSSFISPFPEQLITSLGLEPTEVERSEWLYNGSLIPEIPFYVKYFLNPKAKRHWYYIGLDIAFQRTRFLKYDYGFRMVNGEVVTRGQDFRWNRNQIGSHGISGGTEIKLSRKLNMQLAMYYRNASWHRWDGPATPPRIGLELSLWYMGDRGYLRYR